jgi:hypothetical protein
MDGILKKCGDEYIIFKGNNYSITDKLEGVVGYKTKVYIADEKQVLLDTEGFLRRKKKNGRVAYNINDNDLNAIINNKLNTYINIEIKNVQRYSDEGVIL